MSVWLKEDETRAAQDERDWTGPRHVEGYRGTRDQLTMARDLAEMLGGELGAELLRDALWRWEHGKRDDHDAQVRGMKIDFKSSKVGSIADSIDRFSIVVSWGIIDDPKRPDDLVIVQGLTDEVNRETQMAWWTRLGTMRRLNLGGKFCRLPNHFRRPIVELIDDIKNGPTRTGGENTRT